MYCVLMCIISCFFFFKQKTAYEMRISDWSSDVCSSDLGIAGRALIVEVVDGCEIAKRPSAILTGRSEEHTSELQSLMRISYAVFGLKKKNIVQTITCNGYEYRHRN